METTIPFIRYNDETYEALSESTHLDLSEYPYMWETVPVNYNRVVPSGNNINVELDIQPHNYNREVATP